MRWQIKAIEWKKETISRKAFWNPQALRRLKTKNSYEWFSQSKKEALIIILLKKRINCSRWITRKSSLFFNRFTTEENQNTYYYLTLYLKKIPKQNWARNYQKREISETTQSEFIHLVLFYLIPLNYLSECKSYVHENSCTNSDDSYRNFMGFAFVI